MLLLTAKIFKLYPECHLMSKIFTKEVSQEDY